MRKVLTAIGAIIGGGLVVFGLLLPASFVALETLAHPAPPRAPAPGEGSDAVDIIVEGASPDLVTFTDPATGCDYLVGRRGGVTPRLDAVGRPICRGQKYGEGG